ncbi:YtxH domain-containing protein, partial [Mesorhizobium sp.]
GRGALIGAAVGAGSGLLVRNLRNGYCVYRRSDGTRYKARCN